ncbi:MAG: FlgD immunoglobulin-like domain containing protein [bacterium]
MCTLLLFNVNLQAESATVTWDANTESDLNGYKIYYGTNTLSYDEVIDVGNTTSFTVSQLQVGQTYFFAVTAYDFSGNESGFSQEVSLTIQSKVPPALAGITVSDPTQIDALFSKPLDRASAENKANYTISNGVQVTNAILDADLKTVHLTTTEHQLGQTYTITISNVSDTEGTAIGSQNTASYKIPDNPQSDTTPPQLVSVDVKGKTQIDINFSEPIDKTSAENISNYSISPNLQIAGAVLDNNTTKVHLITSDHQDGVTYTIIINNIFDRAATPNQIAANTKFSYTFNDDTDNNGSQPSQTPDTFTLFPNFPNPFNPETEIRFFLDKPRDVELKVYNPLGQLVKTIVSQQLPEGQHRVMWDGTNNDNVQVPSGVYIYSLEVKRDVQKGDLLVNVALERRVRKMTLMR